MTKKPKPSPIDTANSIRPLLEQAKLAYGSQTPGSEARRASEMVNAHLLIYVERGGSLPDLAKCLEGDISISGLRRRVRIARGQDTSAMEGTIQVAGRVNRPRSSKDPELVAQAVKEIRAAREIGGRTYGDAVRKWHDENVSVTLIAKELGISTYSLWSCRRTAW